MKSPKGNKLLNGKVKLNITYFLLTLPGMICLIMLGFVPCFGLLLAFKNFNYLDGILGSPWVGFKNFQAFFKTNDFYRVVGNTVMYNLVWTFLVNIFLAALVAIALYDVRKKALNKAYQTTLLIPGFVSAVAMSYAVYIFLSHENGLINRALTALGKTPIQWYNEPKYWPFIITVVVAVTQIGMASLYFYSALLSVDTQLFEAAEIDGAKKLKQLWYISIPELMPMMCMVLIGRMGQILASGLDPFYSLTLQSTALYPTTDVLATYLYRGMTQSSIGVTTAISLFTNLVGIIMITLSNTVVKKINPEMAMY